MAFRNGEVRRFVAEQFEQFSSGESEWARRYWDTRLAWLRDHRRLWNAAYWLRTKHDPVRRAARADTSRQWRSTHPDQIKAYRAATKELRLAQARARYAANKEQIPAATQERRKAYMRAYREKNRARMNQQCRDWHARQKAVRHG